MGNKRKLVIGITGASGALYAKQFLDTVHTLKNQWEVLHIVMSKNAMDVWKHELGNDEFKAYASIMYESNDFQAPFASGSATYDTLVIIPCSMGTLGRISAGVSTNLILRTADVMLKEKRKVICVIRETPYNLIHINNMQTFALAGGIVCPATPSFYHKPSTIEETTQSVVNRVIQLMELQNESYEWGNTKL